MASNVLHYTTDPHGRTISFWKGECCLMDIHINAPLGSIANRIKQLCDIHAIHSIKHHEGLEPFISEADKCHRCEGDGLEAIGAKVARCTVCDGTGNRV